MFEQMKQMKQALDLQNQLKKEKIEVDKEGVKVIMNGLMEIEDIKLNPAHDTVKLEKLLKEAISEANKQLQVRLMQLAPMLKGKMGM
ncbi:MAG: YbaB/EbfC family nucleoid-associated protein [Candidatus Paceibacterota bacterium]